jgi:hypothetical protein
MLISSFAPACFAASAGPGPHTSSQMQTPTGRPRSSNTAVPLPGRKWRFSSNTP